VDSVEWLQLYNQAVNHAERMTAPDSKATMMLVLQLLNGLHAMIQEMQVEEDC
jgi:hypothetical protein